jgi:hypothetical protein
MMSIFATVSFGVRDGLRYTFLGLAAAGIVFASGCTMKLSFDPQTNKSSGVDDGSASVTRLTQLLSSNDPQVRAIAAVELGGMGVKARPAMSDLAQLASDPDRHVRFVAVRAMTQIDPADRVTVPTLVLVADDPQSSSDDRKAALALLGDMGQSAQSAIPALERIQNGDDPEMRTAARTALSRIDLNRIEPTNGFGPMPVTSRFQSQSRPTTQPTTRPSLSGRETLDRVEARKAAGIERPATRPTTAPAMLPKPDLRTVGIAHYSPQQLQAVRDWIARQEDMSETQKREHVAHFERWNRDQQAMVRELQAASPNGPAADGNK